MKIKKIPRQVLILGIISFFTDFASEMLYPITPIFLTAVLGASMATVGLIEGIAEVTAGLLKGYFGVLSDKLGKRSVFVLLGYGISGFVKSLPGFFPFVGTVIFSRTADRVGKGIGPAPRDALLASYAKGDSGAVFGFHRSLDTFGAVAGPITALALLYFSPENYILIFFAAIVPSLLAIFFTFKVKDPSVVRVEKKRQAIREFWSSTPRQYKILLILITTFSFFNSSDVFLILKSKDISHSDLTAIWGYVFYNFVYAVFSYPLGLLADKFGKKNIFIAGLFIFSAVYFGFALNDKLFLVWILFGLYGIYTASTEGVTKAWVSDLIPDQFRGSAIGILTTLTSLAVMIGSILTGFLWDTFGSAVPFYFSAAGSLFVALLLLLIKK